MIRATMLMKRLALPAALALALTACAGTGKQGNVPTLELPQAGVVNTTESYAQWWQRYNDAALTALVERALSRNADLAVAAARVDEAQAQLREARSGFFPSMDANVGAGRSRATERGSFPRPPGTPQITNRFAVGVDIAYEVDLWGRVRSANRSARANLQANREALQGLQSAVAAQTAQAYFNLLALDRKLALTEQTLTTREESLRLLKRRFDAGRGSELELRQAEAEREALGAVLPRLRNARDQAERALAVLAGDSPRQIIEGRITRPEATAALPAVPVTPSGLPADLLARRPDIREAEARLAQAEASVSEARARYFPSIILTGSGGFESIDLSDLISTPARVWSIAASLTQPIFGINQIGARVDAAQARRRQAEAGYVASVQTAFQETFDALGTLRTSSETQGAQSRRVGALRESLRLAQLRFDAGVSGYLDVLDAQRALLGTQSDLIDAQVQQLAASVDLFRALGGGWQEK